MVKQIRPAVGHAGIGFARIVVYRFEGASGVAAAAAVAVAAVVEAAALTLLVRASQHRRLPPHPLRRRHLYS